MSAPLLHHVPGFDYLMVSSRSLPLREVGRAPVRRICAWLAVASWTVLEALAPGTSTVSFTLVAACRARRDALALQRVGAG